MPAINDGALNQLFRTARSYNHYLDQPVGEADLRAIWDLMKWGPTSVNQLPARLVWCTTPDAKEKLAACATGSNPDKIRAAPVTVIIGMDVNFHEYLPELFTHADAKAWFDGNTELRETSAMRNSTLQGAYLIIAARALGFDVGPMSGFDNGAVDLHFFADQPGVRSNFIATLGHGDPATTSPRSLRPPFEKFNRVV